jgi:hypothetical protein
MIPAALVLFTVGLVDIARQIGSARSRLARIVLGCLAVSLVSALALGVGTGANIVLIVVVGVVWTALMPSAQAKAIAGFWPVIALAGLVLLLLAMSEPTQATGWAAEWWTTNGAISDLSLSKTLLLGGTVAFLLESSNIVVRTALQSDGSTVLQGTASPRQPSSSGASSIRAPRPQTWRMRLSEKRSRSSGVQQHLQNEVKALRGGRLIGPLERLFLMGLLFAGAVALFAAVVAAKGIVRFPEIQNDSSKGTQAEYFLVGSMTSWALALAGAALIWMVGASPAELAFD